MKNKLVFIILVLLLICIIFRISYKSNEVKADLGFSKNKKMYFEFVSCVVLNFENFGKHKINIDEIRAKCMSSDFSRLLSKMEIEYYTVDRDSVISFYENYTVCVVGTESNILRYIYNKNKKIQLLNNQELESKLDSNWYLIKEYHSMAH